jgi:hypothetical protein
LQCHVYHSAVDEVVASSLFEGAVTVIYIVLMNCKSMLEPLSNSYGENLMVLYFNTMIKNFDLGISSDYPVPGQIVSSCAIVISAVKHHDYFSFRLPC